MTFRYPPYTVCIFDFVPYLHLTRCLQKAKQSTAIKTTGMTVPFDREGRKLSKLNHTVLFAVSLLSIIAAVLYYRNNML